MFLPLNCHGNFMVLIANSVDKAMITMKKLLKNLEEKTKCKLYVIGFIVLMMMISLFEVEAQHKWAVELRPALNSPTLDLGNTEVVGKLGMEGIVTFQVTDRLAIFTGRSWNKFHCKQLDDSIDLDFSEIGFSYGIAYSRPIGASDIRFVISGAGLLSHTKALDSKDRVIASKRYGLGWQLESGLLIPIGNRWQIHPSIRYRSLLRDMPIESLSKTMEFRYISVGIGIAMKF